MFCRRIYTKLLFNEKNRDLITQDYGLILILLLLGVCIPMNSPEKEL